MKTQKQDHKRLSFCLCALMCLSAQTYASTGHAGCDNDGDLYKAFEFMFAWEIFNSSNAMPADGNSVEQSLSSPANGPVMPKYSITSPVASADSNAFEYSLPHVEISPVVSDQNGLSMPEFSITMPTISTDSNTIEELLPQVAPLDTNNTPSEQKPQAKASYQLWKSRITASTDAGADKNKNEVQSLIAQLSAMQFKQQFPAEETPFVPVEEIVETPDANLSVAANPQEKLPAQPEPNVPNPNKKINDKTMAKLKELLQNPEQLQNSFELGEVLFSVGYFDEAAKCYQRALEQITKDEIVSPEEKGWILFQIGNCLQRSDPKAAIEKYRDVVNQRPESQWKELAQSKIDLLEWYQKDQPEALIKQSKL